MNCPVDSAPLLRAELDAGLPAFLCASCTGHWLRFGDYLGWRERQPEEVPETPDAESEMLPARTEGARRCPDCGYFLDSYSIGHAVPFTLDRCGNCNGIWFDATEWETLRARGLHDNVHEMFRPGWQLAARADDQRRRAEASFAARLGEDFTRTKEFAEWVAAHPRRSEILAYVQSRIRETRPASR